MTTEQRVDLRKSKFLESLREAYTRYSIIPSATNPKPFDERTHHELEFRQIALQEDLPGNWFTDPAHAADPYFYETGRAIALGEKEFLVKEIQRVLSTASYQVDRPREQTIGPIIRSIFERFSQREMVHPTTLFAPIQLMPAMMLWADGSVPWFQVRDQKDYVMVAPGQYLEIIWSNNYVPFKDIFLLDKQKFCEWIFKSQDGTRLSAILTQRNSHFNMVAKTVFVCNIMNAEAGYRVSLN